MDLRGKVTREDDQYVVEVDGTNWCTWCRTLEGALYDVPQMVEDCLRAYKNKGQIEPYLRRIGFKGKWQGSVYVVIRLDVSVAEQLPYERVIHVTWPRRW